VRTEQLGVGGSGSQNQIPPHSAQVQVPPQAPPPVSRPNIPRPRGGRKGGRITRGRGRN